MGLQTFCMSIHLTTRYHRHVLCPFLNMSNNAGFEEKQKLKDTSAKLNSSYQISGNEAIKKSILKEIKNYNNR